MEETTLGTCDLGSVLACTSFGVLQCSCDKHPKLLSLNEQLRDSLGAQADSRWLEYLRESILFMVPFEERDAFHAALDKAAHASEPVAVKHHAITASGQVIQLSGWMQKAIDPQGRESLCFIYAPGNTADGTDATMVNVETPAPGKESTQGPLACEYPGVFARTFGHFDLFVDGRPVVFRNAKEKELLALLIDRKGGAVPPTEAIGYLWEGKRIDERLRGKYRKLAFTLKQTLADYQAASILVSDRGTKSIDTTKLRCDYYELLRGNARARQAFHNAYMSDYSWAESTLATLWN